MFPVSEEHPGLWDNKAVVSVNGKEREQSVVCMKSDGFLLHLNHQMESNAE